MEQGDETQQVVVTGSSLFSLFTDQIRNEEVEAALQLIQLSSYHEEYCTCSNAFCYEEAAADDYGLFRKKIKKEEKDQKDHDQGLGGLGENVVVIRREGIDNKAVKPSSSLSSSSSTSESTKSSVISQLSSLARLEKEVVVQQRVRRSSPKRKQLRVRSIDDLYGITKPL